MTDKKSKIHELDEGYTLALGNAGYEVRRIERLLKECLEERFFYLKHTLKRLEEEHASLMQLLHEQEAKID